VNETRFYAYLIISNIWLVQSDWRVLLGVLWLIMAGVMLWMETKHA